MMKNIVPPPRKHKLGLVYASVAMVMLFVGSVFFVLRHGQDVSAMVASERPINGRAGIGKNYLIDVFKLGSETAVFRDDVSLGGSSAPLEAYRMAIAIGDGKYWTIQLRNTATRSTKALAESDIRVLSKIVNWSDASWVFPDGPTGAWNKAPYVGSGLPGDGLFRQTQKIGDYVEWTVTDADLATLQAYSGPNRNILSVAIDGDNTAANKLPTVQDLVDSGVLDSAALVANGGTLEPADRVIDNYATAHVGVNIDIAENLVGTHTIRFTLTPYKNSLSEAGDRMAVIGGYIENAAFSSLSDTGVSLKKVADLNSNHSVYEYIGRFKPAGASYFENAGNTMYGNDEQSSFVVSVDGNPVGLAHGQMAIGEVEVVRNSTLRHSEIGGGNTPIANVDVTYKMLPNIGLDVAYSIEHLTDGQVNAFYSLMLPVNGNLNKGSLLCSTQDFLLNNNDANYVGGCRGDMAWLWDADSGSAVLFEAKDVDNIVNNWQNSGGDGPLSRVYPNNLSFEDRDSTSGSFQKIVLMRVADTEEAGAFKESYNRGDVWSAHGVLRAKVLNNADAVLARVDDVASQVPGAPNAGLFGILDGASVAVTAIFLITIAAVLSTTIIVGYKIILRRRSKRYFDCNLVELEESDKYPPA